MFALSAAMLELVDLALDQVLASIADPSMVVYSNALGVVEFLIGIFSVLMAYFSIDRLLVFLRSICFELRYIGLHAKKIPPPLRARDNAGVDQELQPVTV